MTSVGEVCGEEGFSIASERVAREWASFERANHQKTECLRFPDEFVILPKGKISPEFIGEISTPAFVVPRTANKRNAATRFLTRPAPDSQKWAAFKFDLAKSTGIQNIKLKSIWSRSFGHIVASATTERSCVKSEFVIWRKDGSALRSVCLDGVVAAVSKSGDGFTLEFLEVADGDIFAALNLSSHAATILDVQIDGNRAVVIYENIKQRRIELKLVEFYTEHHAIDRLASLKKMLHIGDSKVLKQSVTNNEGGLKVYDATYIIDLPDISSAVFTQTLKRLTPQTLVLHSSGTEKLYQIPHRQLSARRWLPPSATEIDSDPSLPDATVDADAGPYEPLITPIPIAFVRAGVDVHLRAIPSLRESGTFILAGNETIPFRPAAIFDSLPSEFSHAQVGLSLLTLFFGVIFLFNKTIRNRRKVF